MRHVRYLEPHAEGWCLPPCAVSRPGGPLQLLDALQDGQEGGQQVRGVWPARADHLFDEQEQEGKGTEKKTEQKSGGNEKKVRTGWG